MSRWVCGVVVLGACAAAGPWAYGAAEQDADIVKANSYDDAWEDNADGWAATMRHMWITASGKTDGFVVLLGDSITYAEPFGWWACYGDGKTSADNAICQWMRTSLVGDGTNGCCNGWYLASCRARTNGSYTAQPGITSGEFLAGAYGLPSVDQMFSAGYTNPDGKQYRDAVMAVVLLGTNDLFNGTAGQVSQNLDTILTKLEAAKVIPILTTVPPCMGYEAKAANFNAAIRSLAQSRKVPLIDFHAEILRRRPGTTWQYTLISGDGVHPTTIGGAYDACSDPYTNNGEPLSNVGYLLRCWLTVQKIAEVKAKVLDVVRGDLNRDGHVDVTDLLILAASWPLSSGTPGYDQRCDLDGDNAVDVTDLLMLAENFGKY